MIDLLTLKDCPKLGPINMSDEHLIHVLSNGTLHNIDDFLYAYALKSKLKCSVVVEPFNSVEQFIIQSKSRNLNAVISLVFDAIEIADITEFSARVKAVTDMCCLSNSR